MFSFIPVLTNVLWGLERPYVNDPWEVLSICWLLVLVYR